MLDLLDIGDLQTKKKKERNLLLCLVEITGEKLHQSQHLRIGRDLVVFGYLESATQATYVHPWFYWVLHSPLLTSSQPNNKK